MIEREKPTLRRICPICGKRYKRLAHLLATMFTLKEQGLSYRKIGKRMHISYRRVCDHYNKYKHLKESVWERFINFVKFWGR